MALHAAPRRRFVIFHAVLIDFPQIPVDSSSSYNPLWDQFEGSPVPPTINWILPALLLACSIRDFLTDTGVE